MDHQARSEIFIEDLEKQIAVLLAPHSGVKVSIDSSLRTLKDLEEGVKFDQVSQQQLNPEISELKKSVKLVVDVSISMSMTLTLSEDVQAAAATLHSFRNDLLGVIEGLGINLGNIMDDNEGKVSVVEVKPMPWQRESKKEVAIHLRVRFSSPAVN